MIAEKIKTYALIAGSFLIAAFLYVFWRRGEKLAKIQAELFHEKVKKEVIKYEEQVKEAKRVYDTKRSEYNELAAKFKRRARKKK